MLNERDVQELTASQDLNSERFDAQREDSENLRATLEASFAAAKESASDDEDLEQSRAVREELEELFPGKRASELGSTFADLESRVTADPVNGGYEVQTWAVRNLARFGDGKSARAEMSGAYGLEPTKLPDGTEFLAAKGSVADTIAKAMAQADPDEAKRLRDLQKKLGGRKLSEHMRLAVDFARDAGKNPYLAGAKLAGLKGLPLDDEQASIQQANRAREAEGTRLLANDYADVSAEDLRRYISNGWIQAQPNPRDTLELARGFRDLEARIERELSEFKARTPDYESVKAAMAELVGAGQAKSLDDAYRQVKRRTIADDVRRAAKGRL